MKKKVKKIISIFTALLLIVSIGLLISAVISRINNKTPSLFGYTFHYVVTPSMEPEIKVGDFVIAKKADADEANVGDYVVFISPDPKLNGITIIHSVVEKEETANGVELTTSGIKEGSNVDEYPVKEIIGIYQYKSSFLGKVVIFFSEIRNILFLIVVVTALTIVIKQSVKVYKGLKDNNDKDDEK